MHTALAGLSTGVSSLLPALGPAQAVSFALCSSATLIATGLAGVLFGWWLRSR